MTTTTRNALHGITGTSSWIGDGTEGATLETTLGETNNNNNGSTTTTTIVFRSAKRGTPFNIRLQVNDNDGDDDVNHSIQSTDTHLYYEIEVLESAAAAKDEESGSSSSSSFLAVGFVTQSEFQPGWKTRGMFYNGQNLTNGSAGLLMGFGGGGGDTRSLPPKVGHKVGVYLVRDDDDNINDNDNNNVSTNKKWRVMFYDNGRCLGSGFVVTTTTTDHERWYPCLRVDGTVTVKYTAPAVLPVVTVRQPAPVPPSAPYAGDHWVLKQALTGPELHELPLPHKDCHVTLRLDPLQDHKGNNDCTTTTTTKTYQMSIHAGNIFQTNICIVGKMESFDKIKIGSIASTRRMPPPHMQPLETFLGQALPMLQKMKMLLSDNNDDDTLLIMTGTTAEMIWTRQEKTFQPLTTY